MAYSEKHSLSSGERKGNSPDFDFLFNLLDRISGSSKIKTFRFIGVKNCVLSSKTALERPAKEGNSPVYERYRILYVLFLSTSINECVEGNRQHELARLNTQDHQ